MTSEAITGLYGKTLSRGYDSLGRVSSLTIGSEYSTGYSYDALGRIGSVSSGSDSFTYSYLANSDLISGIAYPNGITAAKSYEANRDLIASVENKFGQTSVSKYDYVNDTIGRRTSMAKSGSAFSASDSIAYGYNSRSEVTSAAAQTETAYSYAFNFDNIGNRTTATERGTSFTYTANSRNQYSLINDGADKTPAHDFDGNMTSNGNGWTYTWDAENRLATAVSGTSTLQFKYDYLSRRVEKKVLNGSTVTKDELFVYDDFKQIEKLDAANSNAIVQKFTWNGERILSVFDVSTSTAYSCLHDANKNVTELLDGSGNIAAHYEYSPFGKVTVSTGAYASANPFRFSSEYADDETGLVYYNFRYYSPDIGKWLSRDPIAELGGQNLSAYNKNRAINAWDLDGLYPDASDTAFGGGDPADRRFHHAMGDTPAASPRNAGRTTANAAASTPPPQQPCAHTPAPKHKKPDSPSKKKPLWQNSDSPYDPGDVGFGNSLLNQAYSMTHPFSNDAYENSALGQTENDNGVAYYGTRGALGVATAAMAIATLPLSSEQLASMGIFNVGRTITARQLAYEAGAGGGRWFSQMQTEALIAGGRSGNWFGSTFAESAYNWATTMRYASPGSGEVVYNWVTRTIIHSNPFF